MMKQIHPYTSTKMRRRKILTEMAEAGNESCEEIEESIPDSLPDLIEVVSIRSTDDEQGTNAR